MAKRLQSSEIHPGPGFRIRKTITRPEPELIQRFSEFETPDISDMMNRLYTMDPGLKNLVNKEKILGPACTIKVFPGDNLMVHKALDIVQPGDIMVIDAGASSMNGIIGDIIATKASHRGVAGIVIDGLIRDLPGIRALGMPVYARGITPIGPLHRGPGEINFAVSCGGIVVNPGDLICGDENGLVVVRKEFAGQLLDQLINQRAELEEYIGEVRRGLFSNEWADRILENHRCLVVDEAV
jgi:RraA family protein